MEHPNFSVAVIGCGHWGKNLVRNFSEIGVLKAISDPSLTIQKNIQDKYNVPATKWKKKS